MRGQVAAYPSRPLARPLRVLSAVAQPSGPAASLPYPCIRTASGEPCNLYHLLEQHFIEGSLPAQDKWWRCVREAFNPDVLENWRPRVNGVQLKVG